MPEQQIEKGKLLYQRLIRVLVAIGQQVPLAGGAVVAADAWLQAGKDFREESQRVNIDERLHQLEQASYVTPEQIRNIVYEVIAEERKKEKYISVENERKILEIATTVLPSTIRKRTQIISQQPSQKDETTKIEFYFSSLQRFYEGDPVLGGPKQWRLVRLIDIGGFGEVWEVRHQTLNDRFAVKFYQDDASILLLQQEANVLLQLRRDLPKHSNIVNLIDLHLDKSPHWLAFEYVGGGTLEFLMRRKQIFSWQESLKIFIPVLKAMSEVHAISIVHRDLKPANVLLTEQDIPKITDFGIGKVLNEKQSLRSTTMAGMGSLGYASPEQLRGEPAHTSDDVYALAVILWQMLTGTLEPPTFPRAKLEQLYISKPIKNFILDCLEKPRGTRPKSAVEMLKALQKIEQKKSKKLISLILLVALLTVGIAAYFLHYSSRNLLLDPPTLPIITDNFPKTNNSITKLEQFFPNLFGETTPELNHLQKWWNQIDEKWKGIFIAHINKLPDYQPTDADLENIINLQKLDLKKKNLTDLEPLKKLTQLRVIDAQENQVSSLEPLRELSQLREIDIWGNRVNTLEPISSLYQLQVLDADNNQLSSLLPLRNLTKLKELRIKENQLSDNDLTYIKFLSQLQKLNIAGNRFKNMEDLQWLSELRELNVRGNSILDITSLQGLKQLQVLLLHHNQIGDLSPLTNLNNLRTLEIESNPINSLESIQGLTGLQKLIIGKRQFSETQVLEFRRMVPNCRIIYK